MDVVYRCGLMGEVPSCHCVLASVPLSLRLDVVCHCVLMDVVSWSGQMVLVPL